jgi:hypothetical protein
MYLIDGFGQETPGLIRVAWVHLYLVLERLDGDLGFLRHVCKIDLSPLLSLLSLSLSTLSLLNLCGSPMPFREAFPGFREERRPGWNRSEKNSSGRNENSESFE